MLKHKLLRVKKKNQYYVSILKGKKLFRLPRYYSSLKLTKLNYTKPQKFDSCLGKYNLPLNFRFYLNLFTVNTELKIFNRFELLYSFMRKPINLNTSSFFTKNFYKLIRTYIHYQPYEYYGIHGFTQGNSLFRQSQRLLMLNFRRFRFFPNIQSLSGSTYTSLSLGLFSKFFNKGKSFIKNKSTFMVVAGFLRKLLLFSSLKQLMLIVKRTPLYLQEILSSINSPVINFYKHPFSNSLTVDESKLGLSFYFYMFIFYNSKPFNYLKTRKRGRIKRKITKRIVKINKLVD